MSLGSDQRMESIARRVAQLSPEQRALLDKLAQQQGGAARRGGITPRSQAGAPSPLSFGQQRLWFLEQLTPGTSAYNVSLALGLRGSLNGDALRRSLDEIACRHQVLRMVVQAADGAPMQVVTADWRLALATVDLRHLTGDERAAATRRLAAEEADRPFDLQAGPLVRASLFQLAADEHVLLLVLHHIVADGWSMGVLLGELTALYADDRPSPLAELPIQYADFAAWQRERLDQGDFALQVDYWKRQLAGVPALELPLDHPRPPVVTYRGGAVPLSIAPALTAALKALSRREDVTLYMTLLAAFQTLLGRYTGQEDMTVGTPAAGRARPEVAPLIGCFVNTLALRTNLGGDPTFLELLKRVRGVAVDAFARQDVPFEKLIEEIQPERDLGQNPLFQALFVLQNTPTASLELPNIALQPFELERCTAKLDLSLELTETADGLHGVLEYSTELFERATVERLAAAYATLLEGIAADPGRRLSALPLLPAAETAQLAAWNATERPYDLATPLHEQVAAQARRTPDAVALAFEGDSLTYRALDQQAGRLARVLAGLGVGPEVLVGVCLERSLDLLPALLGVLRAGGAYVPLDPGYPAERLAYMLADAGCPVVLCHAATRDRLPATGAVVLDLDDLHLDALDLDAPAPDLDAPAGADAAGALAPLPAALPVVRAEHLAYAIYTSGSTGRPKGALNTHRGIGNRLWWMQEQYGLGPDDVVLQKTPLGFDVSVWELFWPLLVGARLVLAPPGAHQDPAALAALVAAQAVTTVHFVPSMLAAFLEALGAGAAGGPDACRSLRRIVCSGEALAPDLAARCRDLVPWAALWNLYGPTEAAVDVTAWRVPADGPLDRVPIGRPIANTHGAVLDRQGRLLPVGAAGELVLGGVQVGRGYLGRPGLTAEKFTPDPFSREPGARRYRTGDRARWLPDGTLEYLGRLDQQVKLRGQRLELGEVEAALRALPGVAQAAAALREDRPGQPRLVGYVVPADGACAPTLEAVRRDLGATLPEYMLPSALVALAALPLTPSGKLDRRALPAPEPPQAAEAYVAPRTPAEELLAGIWAGVLGVARVGAEDNFFALGGHSLLATQVIARVRQAFGAAVPLRALFAAPVLADFARVVAAARRADLDAAPPLTPAPRDRPLPLSFGQHRLWVFEQLRPERSPYSVPAALRLAGPLDAAALRRAFAALVERHEVLRTVLPAEDDQPVQLIQPSGEPPVTEIDLQALPAAAREDEVRRRMAEEVRRPFDLERGPLLRVHLFRLGPEAHVLLLNLHHIVCDAWSLGILVRELGECYRAFTAGEAPALPPLALQYADYAVWQRRWLDAAARREQLAYWRRQLAGAPPVLLPTDRPRQLVQRFVGASCPLALPAALVAALRALAKQEGVTLFMTLLAGLQALLSRSTEQADIVVGAPIAGRPRVELEPLIGFFVNTLVLRTDLSGDPTGRELLARVRRVALDAYAHQDVPFEQLVEMLQPDRSAGGRPLVQAALTLQNVPAADLDLPGLQAQLVPLEADTAKFDLTIGLTETEDGLIGAIEYDADLFDAATIHRFAAHFTTLLGGMAADPGRRLSALPLLAAAEERQLAAWGGPTAAYDDAPPLHEWFAAQARRTPDAVAVVCAGASLSYRALDARAERLARALAGRGVGPDVLVGVCLERSLELVVALLGVLKAGGAYVPLDPGYPAERLAYMLADAGCPIVLCHAATRDRLPATGAAVVDLGALDVGADAPDGAGAASPRPAVRPGHLAYVIYTSGSTGRPKGVMVSHANVTRLFRATERLFHFGAADVWTLFHSYAFDFSVWELWGALLYGGKLVVVPYWVSRSPREFHALLRAEGVTILNQTPAAFHQLIGEDAAHSAAALRLRLVIFGGEALEFSSLRPWFARHGDHRPRLVNMYGITETTVHVTHRPLRDADVSPSPASMVGRPLPDLRAAILDRRWRVAPIGAPGELYVGGAGVARGYLGRPGLTAERFVPDPFAGEPGARRYKTGDLARYRAGGDIEYLGRIDRQVKVRGHRIELGEIEAALGRHPAVAAATVLAREDRPGDRRLTAYLTTGDGQAPDARALRDFLAARLPDYMVPAAFVHLQTLPLTPNGKVDRRALPAPDVAASGATAAGYVAPRTPAEALLAGIWAGVLGVARVGAEDNFFALGGDSILALQVVTRAGRAGLPIAPRQVFQHQTLAALAAAAAAAGEAAAGEPAAGETAAEQGPVTGPVPLTPIQRWFFEQDQPDAHHFNQALLLAARERLDPAPLEQAVQALLTHHDALRLRCSNVGGAWRQEIAAPEAARAALWIVDLGSAGEAARADAETAAATAQASLDLGAGPLFRAVLFRAAGERDRLLLAAHHLVVDAVSWRVLVEDLATAYRQAAGGGAVVLPPKTASYRRWAEALAAAAHPMAAPALDAPAVASPAAAELGYWAAEAAGARPLPVDRPGGAGTVASARVVTAALPVEQTQALLRGGSAEAALLAALARAVVPWAGGPVLVDREGHGRDAPGDAPDVSRTVGWFTSLAPLRLAAAATPGATLAAVRTRLAARPERGVGYASLRWGDDPAARQTLAALPQAQLLFNYLGQFDQGFGPESLFDQADGSVGPLQSPRQRLHHLLEVNAAVIQGQLRLVWTYSGDAFSASTIDALFQRYQEELRLLIAPGRSDGSQAVAADFPQARVSQRDLDAFLAHLSSGNRSS